MKAPRHINAGSVTVQPLVQLVKIAQLLANPIRFFHADHIAAATDGLSQDDLDGFCRTDEIAKRLNAVVVDRMGTSTLNLHATAPRNADIDNVRDLVVAPYTTIEGFLAQVTAVRLQHAIRACVLKADRERARTILGDAAYNTALREAPYFYTGLAAKTQQAHSALDTDAVSPAFSVGATMAHSYIAAIDKGLAQIFAWRLPKVFIADAVPLDAAQSQSFARLLASKGPQVTTGAS